MTKSYHHSLLSGRWQQFTLSEQLANIGSEVGRVALAKEGQDRERLKHAFGRAKELMDATINDPRWAATPRRRELKRVRELLVDYGIGSNKYGSTKESWDKYFLPFNYAARVNR